MPEIRVLAYDDVQSCVASGWPTHVISLLNRDMPCYGPQHLHLLFDDVSVATPRYITPLVKHVDQVLAFTAALGPSDRVLIHCLAGISRSTAMAIGVLIQHGMTYQDAYAHIATIRPQLAPNRLITRYLDEHFKLGGHLIRLVADNDPYAHVVVVGLPS